MMTKEILRPLQNETQGSFYIFYFFQNTIYKSATFSLTAICLILLAFCMVSCFCYCKKHLNQIGKFKLSDDNLFTNNGVEILDAMERGGYDNVRMRRADDDSVFSI